MWWSCVVVLKQARSASEEYRIGVASLLLEMLQFSIQPQTFSKGRLVQLDVSCHTCSYWDIVGEVVGGAAAFERSSEVCTLHRERCNYVFSRWGGVYLYMEIGNDDGGVDIIWLF